MSADVTSNCRSCGSSAARVRQVLLVQSRSDLALLKTWGRHYDSVQLRIANLPEAERFLLEEAIAGNYFACGCIPTRWAVIGVLALVIPALVVSRDRIVGASWEVMLIATLSAILIPLATMLASIARARVRLWRLLDAAAK
jgi:hypothetical protein